MADLALPLELGQRADWSSPGTCGSMRCSWKRSMRSRPSRRRLPLARLAQVLGPAVGAHRVGPGRGQPGLGRDHQVVGYGCSASRDQPLG